MTSRDQAGERRAATIDWAVGLIERYLEQHPEAADSLEGVGHWWLARQCLEETRAVTELALAEALRRGLVEAHQREGNQTLYTRRKARD